MYRRILQIKLNGWKEVPPERNVEYSELSDFKRTHFGQQNILNENPYFDSSGIQCRVLILFHSETQPNNTHCANVKIEI